MYKRILWQIPTPIVFPALFLSFAVALTGPSQAEAQTGARGNPRRGACPGGHAVVYRISGNERLGDTLGRRSIS